MTATKVFTILASVRASQTLTTISHLIHGLTRAALAPFVPHNLSVLTLPSPWRRIMSKTQAVPATDAAKHASYTVHSDQLRVFGFSKGDRFTVNGAKKAKPGDLVFLKWNHLDLVGWYLADHIFTPECPLPLADCKIQGVIPWPEKAPL